ncbi:hypothetical protein C1645_770054 [Glomus cerebriforme]|uniref:Uncharacterized protein n=1 Tax=Glomus cerebriforme TaxID=658196 RepID=A0A397SZB0_9GLOM|nr:hypothetical protein C1645_770054 [Glomus cerebriforme]
MGVLCWGAGRHCRQYLLVLIFLFMNISFALRKKLVKDEMVQSILKSWILDYMDLLINKHTFFCMTYCFMISQLAERILRSA